MDVAVPEEPQKKIFRARKTMKISDRQQLESLHNTLPSNVPPSSTPSTSPPPALVNGKHPDKGQTETEKDVEKMESNADKSQKEGCPSSPVSRSPTPPALSLSLSPSPPAQSPEHAASPNAPSSPSRPVDPAVKEGEKGEEGPVSACHSKEKKEKKDGEEEEEEETKKAGKISASSEKEKEDDLPEPQESLPQASAASPTPPATNEGRGEEKGKVPDTDRPTELEETVAMDMGPVNLEDDAPSLDKMAAASSLFQCPVPPANTFSSSPSLSPSHTPESDQEVKEGFLVLSEEEESQGEKEEERGNEGKDEQDGEKMEVDAEKEGEKEENAGITTKDAVVPSTSPAPSSGDAAEEEGRGAAPSTRKRAMTGDSDPAGHAQGGEEEGPGGPEGQSKRPRVEGGELEAHLELKISASPETRLKLEKVVQQLVAEQLRVWQLSVFDRSLQELRERVERIDCATKHQQTLNTLQAKIARLTKKFGAANQAKENARKPQEMLSSPSAAASTPNATTNTTPAYRTVRSILDSKRGEHPGQNQTQSPASSTGPRLPSTSTPPTSSSVGPSPALSLNTTSGPALPSSSLTSVGPSASQNQALMIKAGPANSALAPSTTASAPKPVSLQPLLIQLPLAVTNAQAGALVSNNSSGVELVPVSSLAGVSTLSKAKTTPATTAFIIQKPAVSSAAAVPSSPSLPQITLARAAVYPGSSGIISMPSAGVSVTSARTPTQCASLAGAASSSSLPASAVPAATGGQSSGATASAPVSSASMVSKTDNQATNHAPDSTTTKTPVQASRTSRAGAVIDLTEDDDDVLVTGVKKAPVQSGPSIAASPSSSSPSSAVQRAPGPGPGTLNSHSTMHVQPAAQTTVNVLQRPQAVAPSRALSTTSRPLPSSSTSSSLSAPPLHNSGSVTGAVGGGRGLVGVTAAGGSNQQGSPQATGVTVRLSPQSGQHPLNGPQLTVHHRPMQDSPSKNLPSAAPGPALNPNPPVPGLPPLPSSPAPPRLPPEAAHTSPPQQPQLKLARVQSQNGIVLSWSVEETDRTCATVESYHLYAYHQDQSGPASSATSQWKKIGEVKALPLPMACTLTQFVSGSKYYFAVRARDVYGRFGPFCEPQCTDVIAPSSSS
ncbi:hypothetical protein MATL_G00216800 [Megalops atlanticus]|uniref:Fibronectin type-III domain-containing protein n=1 Tax=Megalops atlanticus TaxID=7932 RepID=A0A9D3PHA9_MEGAT|nr:hypothetical protein MATL_G00216800 [Megalops atlanticus]